MKNIGPDYYNISDELTEEELLIQQTANEFVKNEFLPVINEHFEAGTFPKELIPKLGDLGFLGSSLPADSGGAGVSNVAYGLILHELERGDSGLRSFASVQGSLVMYPIYAYGSKAQKEKWQYCHWSWTNQIRILRGHISNRIRRCGSVLHPPVERRRICIGAFR